MLHNNEIVYMPANSLYEMLESISQDVNRLYPMPLTTMARVGDPLILGAYAMKEVTGYCYHGKLHCAQDE